MHGRDRIQLHNDSIKSPAQHSHAPILFGLKISPVKSQDLRDTRFRRTEWFLSHQLSDFFRDLFSGVTTNVVEQSREGCPTPPYEGDTAGPASWLTALGHAQRLQGGLLEVQDWTAGLRTGMG